MDKRDNRNVLGLFLEVILWSSYELFISLMSSNSSSVVIPSTVISDVRRYKVKWIVFFL